MKTYLGSTLFVLALSMVAGCTALSLERHTANQAMTAADIRYQLVLDTLAKVAASPGNLPGLGTITDGTSALTDQTNIDVKTALDGVKGFTSEAISGGVSRSPNLQWTIDTAHTPEQIRAARAACEWVLTGQVPIDQSDVELLKLFQVYDDLERLRALYPGWFSLGCEANVPRHCCYVAHFCGSYFWVVPGGLNGLSEFTLILADIATIAPPSLVGVATFNIVQPDKSTPPKPVPLTQVTVPFTYNDANAGGIDFAHPIVIYGVPTKTLQATWQPLNECITAQPPGHAEDAQVIGAAPTVRATTLPRVPAGFNAPYQFHEHQQRQQLSTQFYLSK